MKHIKTAAQILGLILMLACLVHIGRNPQPAPGYDFKTTSVKIMGKYGHGSGNVVDSTDTESLILTNKHVCKGITQNPALTNAIKILTLMIDKHPECKTFSCLVEKNRMNGMAIFQMFLMLSQVPDFDGVDSEEIEVLMRKLIELRDSDKSNKIQVKFMNLDLKNTGASIVAVSPHVDLCLLKIQVGNLRRIKIANKKPKVGDKVQTIGNPYDAENHMVEGYVGNDTVVWGNVYTLITAPIFPGQSGSSTVNMFGELIGVNTLTDMRAGTIGYMIPLTDIKLFLSGKMLVRKIVMKI